MDVLAAWFKQQPADAPVRQTRRAQTQSFLLGTVARLPEARARARAVLGTLGGKCGWESMRKRAELREILGEKAAAREEYVQLERLLKRLVKEEEASPAAPGEERGGDGCVLIGCTTAVVDGAPCSVLSLDALCSELEEERRVAEASVLRLDLEMSMDAQRAALLQHEPPLKRRKAAAPATACPWDPRDGVGRVDAAGLSATEFHERYACGGRPVVITGLIDVVKSGGAWTREWLAGIIGGTRVPLKTRAAASLEWGQLEPYIAEKVTFQEFAAGAKGEGGYLFDSSVPLHFPELVPWLTVPKYFANDALWRTGEGALYGDSWPSLFVATEATRGAGMHVDTFGSNFWMAVFEGAKDWIFFHEADLPLLEPTYPMTGGFDPAFAIDPFEEVDAACHPGYAKATPVRLTLTAGEVLFVPAGCPHAVRNASPSVAVSGNFVDASNIARAREALRKNGLLDPASAALYAELAAMDVAFDPDAAHTPVADIKRHRLRHD